jgi:hypothetical protein
MKISGMLYQRNENNGAQLAGNEDGVKWRK